MKLIVAALLGGLAGVLTLDSPQYGKLLCVMLFLLAYGLLIRMMILVEEHTKKLRRRDWLKLCAPYVVCSLVIYGAITLGPSALAIGVTVLLITLLLDFSAKQVDRRVE